MAEIREKGMAFHKLALALETGGISGEDLAAGDIDAEALADFGIASKLAQKKVMLSARGPILLCSCSIFWRRH